MSPVAAGQRFKRARPCPICNGGEDMPRGRGVRCSGFLSSDGEWAHCTREEHAGGLEASKADPPTFAHRLRGDCRCGVEHSPGAPLPGRGERARFVAIFDYVDENGTLLFQVCRTADKQFPQRRPDGNGGWVWKLDGVRRVLYRLPRLLAEAQRGGAAVVTEGEKCVQALEQLGLVATCNPGARASGTRSTPSTSGASGRSR
jgi:hypothetical protein